MGEWLVILVVVLAIWVVFESLTFYNRLFCNPFTKARYRKVAGRDHAGPLLEFGLVLLLASSILFFAGLVFPAEAEELLKKFLWSPPSLAVASAISLGVGYHVFVGAPKEARRLLAGDGLKKLHENTRNDLQRLITRLRGPNDDPRPNEPTAESLVSRERKNGLFYLVPGSINFYLPAALLWIAGTGLWADFDKTLTARRTMSSTVPTTIEPFSEFYRQTEGYYAGFRDYETAVLDLARDLTAVLAVVFAVSFYLLGTLVHTIYTRNGQFWIRLVTSLVVFLVLPLLIVLSYLGLITANADVSDTLEHITSVIDLKGLENEQIEAFHSLEDRMRGQVDLPGFWPELATTTGGLVLLAGTVLSVRQGRRSPSSYLKSIVPRSILRSYRERRNRSQRGLEWFSALLSPLHDMPDDRLAYAMRHAIVAIVTADRDVHERERDAALEIMGQVSGVPYGREDLERDLEHLNVRDLEHAFAQVSKRLTEHEKEMLVVACLGVAAADGEASPSEIRKIRRAALALGMSPAHTQSIVSNPSAYYEDGVLFGSGRRSADNEPSV